MGTGPFVASTKLPPGTNAKVPKRMRGLASPESSAKLPDDIHAQLPQPRLNAAERLWRLAEAITFLRQYLAAGPQPARKLLNAATAGGIAERTLHRAKDVLGVTTQRSGGYAGHGQWVWHPPATNADAVPISARGGGALVAERR